MDDLSLFYDATAEIVRTRRNLPHWKQAGKVYFVTWRQGDSLARVHRERIVMERVAWKREHGSKDWVALTNEQRRTHFRLFHERVQRLLDAGAGSCMLQHATPRRIVREALMHFEGERYQLGTYAIAANHVHVLVRPAMGHDLSRILHSWKSYTAKAINATLGRTGTFWHVESFDHLVRDRSSLERIETYVLDHARQGAEVAFRSW